MAGRKKPAKTPRKPTPKKPTWERGFLAALAETGNVRLSCLSAGVDWTTAYDRRRADPDFAAAWAVAIEEAADLLEAEARRRAVEGVRRVKFHQGFPIRVPVLDTDGVPRVDARGDEITTPYVEHEYSDTLLIFLLKGARPEKYRDRQQVEHTGAVANVHVYMPRNGREPADQQQPA